LLNDGTRRVVIGVSAVHDLIPMPPAVAVGTAVTEGLLRIDDEAVVLIDSFSLFESATAPSRDRPLALIALEETPWVRAMLAPLVAAAGYDVQFGTGDGADLVIHLDGDDVVQKNAHSIALAKGDTGGVAVERYDRTTLHKLVSGGKRRRA
jgi:hypothetical protein